MISFILFMEQPPPKTILFPTRRSSDLEPAREERRRRHHRADQQRSTEVACPRPNAAGRRRSEEHTSELQSRQYLVCRPLLEKKKIASPASDSATTPRAARLPANEATAH